jgi:hypothetical protein
MKLAGMAMDRRLGSKIAGGYAGDYARVWKTAFDIFPRVGDAIMAVRGAESRMPKLIEHVAPGAMLLGGELYKRGALDSKQIDAILSKTVRRLKTPRACLAMDQRRIDHDGRLHVDSSNLSKANVCAYLGEEIPYWNELGLSPQKIYMLLRHPDELKRAADSFNGLPILDTHVPMDADSHLPYLVVGTTGSRAKFEPPYLKNAISLWTRDAIDGVNNGAKKQLSCGYSYMPDMTPGVYQGQRYDGVMTHLRGNHVALVDEGRCGADCVVGDSANVKTVRRFATRPAFDQLPKAMQPSQREKDGAARVGEKLQRKKEKLSEAARTKNGPGISEAFDALYAMVEHPDSPRDAMIMLVELLKQSGFTPEQILQKISAMSTPNDHENKKLNWNGSGAAAEDEELQMPMQPPNKMSMQQSNMQQMQDPNKINATTNQARGPTQQESFGRELTGNPHLDQNLPDAMQHGGQAFGIPGTPNTAGTRTPSTQLGRNGNGKFASLIELLDALEAAEQNGGELALALTGIDPPLLTDTDPPSQLTSSQLVGIDHQPIEKSS